MNVGERCMVKNFSPVSLLSVVSKVFERRNNGLFDDLEKFNLFLISGLVLGLLMQLQFLLQLYLIELLELLIGLGLLELQH